MAQPNASPSAEGGDGRLSVIWSAVAGAAVAGVLVLLWSGAPMHGRMMNGRYGAPFAFAAVPPGGLLLGAACTVFGGIALGVAAAILFNVYSRAGRR